ncbi:MAG: hypothetical protein ACN4GW_01015 [Desulforhopalus sp.]
MANSPPTNLSSATQPVYNPELCCTDSITIPSAILSSIYSHVQIDSVARYFGGNRYLPDPETRKRIGRCIREASQLVSPRATYTLFPISRVLPKGEVYLENGQSIHFPECFCDSGARSVAAIIGSLGEVLENRCRELAGSGKIYESTMLDAVGTTLLDLLSEKICDTVEGAGMRDGLIKGQRFAPGIDGYPLEQQHHLFKLADNASIGVELNSSAIMAPAKSISFFMVLTTTPGQNSVLNKCNVCRLANCQYRKGGRIKFTTNSKISIK